MIRRVVRKLRRLARQSAVGSYKQFLSSFDPGKKLDLARIASCREKLRGTYEQYIAEISPANMTVSLELSAVLLALCETKRYTRLLDLGSGLSSFVFRYYAAETPGVTVFSVDDDEAWLAKTLAFLKKRKVETSHVMSLQQFVGSTEKEFDCILHDLNFVEVRIHQVSEALARVKPGGLVVFDDVHKPNYRAELLDKLAGERGAVFSLKPVTLDPFGRYAMAFIQSK